MVSHPFYVVLFVGPVVSALLGGYCVDKGEIGVVVGAVVGGGVRRVRVGYRW